MDVRTPGPNDDGTGTPRLGTAKAGGRQGSQGVQFTSKDKKGRKASLHDETAQQDWAKTRSEDTAINFKAVTPRK